jgi:hypothetical protein
MTTTLYCSFNQAAMIKYNLIPMDLLFLNWMLKFASNRYIKTLPGAEHFFWIKYSKVLDDLPGLFLNINHIRRTISRLSAPEICANKPLVSKLAHLPTGIETYFAFNQDVIDELVGGNMPNSGFAELAPVAPVVTDKNYQRTAINQNVLDIMTELKKIEHNGEPVFKSTLPKDAHHYTNGVRDFQKQLFLLFDGRFQSEYYLSMAQWFKDKYSYYLPAESAKALSTCKGSWPAIKKLVLKAAHNYVHWFEPGTEFYNKEALPRSFKDWIFNVHAKISMFYVCLISTPTDMREAHAEEVHNNLPPAVIDTMEPLKKKEWDGFAFWNKIRGLHAWYKKYAQSLMQINSNCRYWLSRESDFLKDYIAWLDSFTGTRSALYLKSLGIGCATWDCYVGSKTKEHNIDIFIPRTI